jgi:hypothetical protein
MEAMRLALSPPLVNGVNAGFLRDEARLAVVFISEEDDHSGYAVQDYVGFLARLKGGGTVANAIVDIDQRCADASGIAHRYLDLVNATGGAAASICLGNFTPLFRTIAERSYTPETGFVLAAVPGPGGIAVKVDGAVAPPGSFVYDAAANEVRFPVAPRPGARIEVSYTPTCN